MQDLPYVTTAVPDDAVLGVGEVRHLLELRTDHAHVVADPAHHLQFLVEHHVQLVGLLAVGEEVQHAVRGGPLTG